MKQIQLNKKLNENNNKSKEITTKQIILNKKTMKTTKNYT